MSWNLARRWRAELVDGVKDAALRARLAVGKPAPETSAGSARRILMVDDLLPDPLFGAGYPRAFAIVRALVRAGHAVDFYPMQSERGSAPRMAALFGDAVRFHDGHGARGLRRLLWRRGDSFDLIFVSRPGPMRALRDARWRSRTPGHAPAVIYDAEAVLSPREARRRALFGDPWSDTQYRAALRAELSLAWDAGSVTAVGRGDAATIAAILDLPVFVLPHPVSVREGAAGIGGRRDLLFVGRLTGEATQSPNVDSVQWFVTEVMPRLDARIGVDYRLHVAGRMDAEELTAIASDRVVFHGVVDDLTALYNRCRVFVAPTRYAAGIPLKVVEAMGEGIPCVVTPLLAAQLEAEEGALAIGDGADAFADACARLYADDAAWLAIQAAGRKHVARSCSPAAFDQVLHEVIDQAVRGH